MLPRLLGSGSPFFANWGESRVLRPSAGNGQKHKDRQHSRPEVQHSRVAPPGLQRLVGSRTGASAPEVRQHDLRVVATGVKRTPSASDFVFWRQRPLIPLKEKCQAGSAPPRHPHLANDYPKSFGISDCLAFLARTHQKINPNNSRQAKAVKKNPIRSSLLFVTDAARRLFPRVVESR
jgi:hypothetical protein